MYEGKMGALRLMDALESIMQDKARMAELGELLYYDEEQLAYDIQALLKERA